MIPSFHRTALAAVAVVLFCLGAARATSYNWAAAVSGNWSDRNNWSPAGAPRAGDWAAVAAGNPPGAVYTVTLDAAPSVAGSVLEAPGAWFSAPGRSLAVSGQADPRQGVVRWYGSS